MSNVIAWIKSNVFIVIFVLVMIAALVTLPIVGKKLNSGVRANVEDRAKRLTELDRLQKTSVEVPGDPAAGAQMVLVNEDLVRRYRDAIEAQQNDAELIFKEAEAHNRKGRVTLMPELFPDPPPYQAEVLPSRFKDVILEAYTTLLADVKAGAPPAAEDVQELLTRRQSNFLTQTLLTDDIDSLDDQQRAELRKELTSARTRKYLQNAETISLYAKEADLDRPVWDPTVRYEMAELFDWQWKYWVQQDILLALADANADAASVIEAPVKRIVRLGVRDMQTFGDAGASSAGGSQRPGLGGMSGGGGRGGGGGAAPAAAAVNPKLEAAIDFSTTITGRSTNKLYDVRIVDLTLLVDPVDTPRILDALAARNFITVVNLQMIADDSFSAMEEGYYFGNGALARLQLTLETVWLRTWTKEYMPESVRAALGIALDPKPAAADQS